MNWYTTTLLTAIRDYLSSLDGKVENPMPMEGATAPGAVPASDPLDLGSVIQDADPAAGVDGEIGRTRLDSVRRLIVSIGAIPVGVLQTIQGATAPGAVPASNPLDLGSVIQDADPAAGVDGEIGRTRLDSVRRLIVSIGAIPSGVATAYEGILYNATTPDLSDTDRTPAQGDKRGVSYVGASIRHRRVIPLSADDEGELEEGACDEVRFGTDDVFLFGQPTERSWLIVNGGFDSGANWTAGANWTISAGVATHTAGATATLSQDSSTENPEDPIVTTETYILIFTVSGRSAGTITGSVGGTAGAGRTTNDTFVEAITANGLGDLTVAFTPDSAFDGSIDNVFLIPANGPYKAASAEPDGYSHIVGVAATSDPATLLDDVRVEAGWYRRAGATELG